MNLIARYRSMARNNAWSNARLFKACTALRDEEFRLERVSFFPTLQETLNHILSVDLFDLEAFEQGRNDLAILWTWTPRIHAEALYGEQLGCGRRLIAFCVGLTEASLLRTVRPDRGSQEIKEETAGRVPSNFSSTRSITAARPTPCLRARASSLPSSMSSS